MEIEARQVISEYESMVSQNTFTRAGCPVSMTGPDMEYPYAATAGEARRLQRLFTDRQNRKPQPQLRHRSEQER